MDVVKAIEKVGSNSGTMSQQVKIADCGQLLNLKSYTFYFMSLTHLIS